MACAAQGPPTAPRIETPARVADLAAAQVGRTLELRFTPPSLATDGERLSKPMDIEMFRSASAPGGKPATVSATQAPWLTLAPDDWSALLRPKTPGLSSEPHSGATGDSNSGATSAQPTAMSGRGVSGAQQTHGKQAGRRGSLSLRRKSSPSKAASHRDLEGSRLVYIYSISEGEFNRAQGSSIVFAVRGVTHGFRGRPIPGELSNPAAVTLIDVSPPVEGVVARQPTERALEIQWSQPVRTLGGNLVSSLAGYRIYRSTTGTPGSFEPISETSKTKYEDPDFLFGCVYFYRVRAIFKQEGHSAASEDSLPAKIQPVDTFPPAAPSALTGVYTAGRVELIWSTNAERDLAGYNLYRRMQSGPAQRINSGLLTTPVFHDNSAVAGQTYSYWVTAVDLARNESSSSKSVEVNTR